LREDDSDDDDTTETDVECSTLREAADVAASDNRSADVIILPPSTVDAVSDEETGDDDDLSPSSLPGEVAGPLVVHLHNDNADHDEKATKKQSSGKRPKAKSVTAPKWKKHFGYKEPLDYKECTKLSELCPQLASKTPYELFQLYYDDEMRRLIVTESVKYARQKNNQKFTIEECELDIFVAILLFSGYHSLPRERLYWCRDEDLDVSYVSSRMSRNRFEDMKRYLHLSDNSRVDPNDKLHKIRPFVNLCNAKLQQHGVFSQYLSIDEQMVPFFGHHSAKMFIRSKPIRFGFKLWVLASDSGYPYYFIVYCGKSTGPNSDQVKELGLGHQVVSSLLSIVSSPECHEVFFDNFFTSYDLLHYLKSIKIKATGTARENRLKQCPLQDTKLMKKTPRGTHDSKCDGIVGIVKWHDNQCVTVATNYDSVDTVGKVKRWSVANKAAIEVPQPTVVNNYNCHMGGVDMLDSFMANYRPTFRSKKWWWPLFLNGLNMLVVAAWKLHVEVGGKFDQLAFRRYIVRSLMHSVNPSAVQAGPGPRPLDEVRKDGLHHHLSRNDKQARCRVCMKNCRMKCTKCDVPLHIHCELAYHTQ